MVQTCNEYVSAFREGAELVLSALEGRLGAGNFDEDALARLRDFLEDYHRLTDAYCEAGDEAGDARVPSIHEFVRVGALN